MAEKSITEMIHERRNDILNHLKQMNANDLSLALMEMSVLHSTLGERLVDFEVAYEKIKDEFHEIYPDLSDLKLSAKTKQSPEYLTYRRAEKLEKSVLEMIRSLKKRIAVISREEETSFNL